MESLKGKVAVVTGANQGIGKGFANALAAEGCQLAICARKRRQAGRGRERTLFLGDRSFSLKRQMFLTSRKSSRSSRVLSKKFGTDRSIDQQRGELRWRSDRSGGVWKLGIM